VAGLGVLALAAAPAAASSTGGPTVDCIVPGDGGTYRAVFGYDNPPTTRRRWRSARITQ
jgi:hypothetical protein